MGRHAEFRSYILHGYFSKYTRLERFGIEHTEALEDYGAVCKFQNVEELKFLGRCIQEGLPLRVFGPERTLVGCTTGDHL